MNQTLSIERLVWGGRGLARLPQGKVVMIEPGGLPGETVQVQITEEKRDFARARITTVSSPSPVRQPHPCPHGSACGGCAFGILPVNNQLELKLAMLVDVLNRSLPRAVSRELSRSLAADPSPLDWKYRFRAQVEVRSRRPHFRRLGSHELVPLSVCHLLAPALNDHLHALCAAAPDDRLTIAASPLDGKAASSMDNTLLHLPFRDHPLVLSLHAGCFFQANWACNQDLIRLIMNLLADFDRVADLFAGAGNFALPLSLNGRSVLGVESDVRAVRCATTTARALGLNNLRFLVHDLSQPGQWDDLVEFAPLAAVVDPPRSGGGRCVRQLLSIPSLERLVWISCDAVNSCRDLRPLIDAGWTIEEVRIFDMFPNTWHMETVFVLNR